MGKLINSNIRRLSRSPLFWLAICIWLTLSLYSFSEMFRADLNHSPYSSRMNSPGFYEYEEDGILKHDYIGEYYHTFDTFWEAYGVSELNMIVDGMGLMVLVSFIACLLVGRDYSDGTIRNKLSIGYSRNDIYGANLITVAGLTFILSLISIAPKVYAYETLYIVDMEPYKAFLIMGVINVILLDVYTAIVSVTIVQLVCKRFASIIVVSALGIAMTMAGALYSSPFVYSAYYNVEGEIYDLSQVYTPFGMAWRFVISVVSPVGQLTWMAMPPVPALCESFSNFKLLPYMFYILPVTSIGVSLIVLFAGKYAFNRRNIK